MSTLLSVKKLCAGYGSSQVLFDVSFDLAPGEVVTLLGRNGMGKSTTVKCLAGWLKASAGSIQFNGQAIESAAPYVIGRLGFGLVPEGRQVFPNLSVHENLVATANNRNVPTGDEQNAWTLERVNKLFPRLAERAKQMAGKMSGGEQQMLAVGRALMTNPRLLVLDEATEGLAPLIRQEIWSCLATLKAAGQSMIVIDKNLKSLMPLANQHYVMEKGRIVWQGDSASLASDAHHVEKYLHV
jgi:branched-chain amino acid transport system ATP-binding protein